MTQKIKSKKFYFFTFSDFKYYKSTIKLSMPQELKQSHIKNELI